MAKDWITKDKLNDVVRSLHILVNSDVLVGIPESTAARDNRETGGDMTNAAIGYIMEKGDPVKNLPARPFLVPGVANSKRAYLPKLTKAAGYALDGDKAKALAQLEAAGTIAEQSAKSVINSGNFAPLSDETLRRRAARGREGAAMELQRRAEGFEPGTDLAKPLIDTGALRNSITHVIRKKE